MSNLSHNEVDQVRSQAQQIVERAKADTAFKQQLKGNPEGALEAAGFPNNHIGEFARELGGDQADVAGYCSVTCLVTCIITSLHDL